MISLHLYGPFTIQAYGLCIAIGLCMCTWMLKRDRNYVTSKLNEHFDTILMLAIMGAIIGGRLLYTAMHYDEMHSLFEIVNVWNGGFAVLGSIIGIFISVSTYLALYHVPILPIADIISLYALLINSWGRVGCFLVGCCHGKIWYSPFATIYTDPESYALLNVPLHPSQLYSVTTFMIVFAILYHYKEQLFKLSGTMFGLYVIIIGLERTLNEYFRYEYDASNVLFNTHQIIGIILALIGIGIIIQSILKKRSTQK